MSKLTYKQRKKLHDSSFAIPEKREYPIEDIEHARNALARVSQFGTNEEKQKVKLAVYQQYPELIPEGTTSNLRKRIETKQGLISNKNHVNLLKPRIIVRVPANFLNPPRKAITVKPMIINRQPIHVKKLRGGFAASRKRIKQHRIR